MPVHLPPISRRRLLQRSLAAGAGLLVGPGILRAAKSADPHSWAMLADIHIAADPMEQGRFGMNVSDHLAHVCKEILSLKTAPAGVIIHGDCAFNSGRTGDYKQLVKLLQPVRERQLPIHLALGNHDHLENFLKAVEPQTQSLVQEKFVSTLQAERANFFILDSLNGDPPGKPSNPGRVGDTQRQWLARQLDEHTKKPAIVIVHHTPAGMLDWKELVELLDDHKQVKAMFYGHRHTWGLSKTRGGVHLINLLPVSYPSTPNPTLGKAAGAIGWTQATFAPDRVRLHVRCINREHVMNDSTHELKWRVA